MSIVIANNLQGPLPLTIPFTAPIDGPVTLAFSATAWSQTTNTIIGVAVWLDSVLLGTTFIYSNGTGEHRTLPTQFFMPTLMDGPHKITLQAANGATVTDSNDFFSLWIID